MLRLKFADAKVYLGFESAHVALHRIPQIRCSILQRTCRSRVVSHCWDGAAFTPSASAILTRSATDLAPIFFMM